MVARGPIIRSRLPGRYFLQHGAGIQSHTTGNRSGAVLINDNFTLATLDTTNTWATAVSGTGAVSIVNTAGPWNYVLLNCPAGSDTARVSDLGSSYHPNPALITAANSVWQRIVLEFLMRTVSTANLDNTDCLWGFQTRNSSAANRAGTNLICFCLTADAINTLTDSGGTETVNTISATPTLTNWNKYRIVVENGSAAFYVNEVLANTHTTNIPVDPLTVWFRIATEGAVAGASHVASVRCWLEDREDGL